MRIVVISLWLALLTACVTTQTGPYTENVSVEKEVESRIQVAIAYLKPGDGYNPGLAISQLKQVYDKSPKSPRVNEILGLALEASGENDKAEYHFKRMLKYDESYTRGRSNYAGFLITQGRYEDAEEQLLVVSNDIYFRKRGITFWQLSLVAKELGQSDNIKKYLLRAISIEPRLAAAYLDLATLAFNEQEYSKSYQYLESYRKNVNQSSASALLLGIKLAQVFKDRDEEASYALALRNLYPKSKECLEYIKSLPE